ncbi:Scr1 family TA system antitoxin-like transcriptional regulator [Streptomyces parvus]|uniref:DUF397 domain-containing protein n=1 Tax=Streptomyces parvus TaxID=66428 RepID=UPI003D731730
MPFSQGRHAGADGAFNICSYPDPMDLDVVNLDYVEDALYLEEDQPVERYQVALDELRATAIASRQSQPTPDGLIAVGDTKDRTLGAHTFGPEQWQAFVTAVRDGSFQGSCRGGGHHG